MTITISNYALETLAAAFVGSVAGGWKGVGGAIVATISEVALIVFLGGTTAFGGVSGLLIGRAAVWLGASLVCLMIARKPNSGKNQGTNATHGVLWSCIAVVIIRCVVYHGKANLFPISLPPRI
jgi:hypothetical protein